MPDQEKKYNERGEVTSSHIAPERGAVDTSAETYGTTAGKGLGAKGKSTAGMPKQEPGEDPAAFGARLRKWREEQAGNPKAEGQKKALRSM